MKKIDCVDIDGAILSVDIDQVSFRPAVYGILIENDKILLSKQYDGYDIPGGGIDMHETIDEALKREFWEETGIEVEKREIVVCETSFYKKGSDNKCYNSILIYYLCKRVGGELSIQHFNEAEKEYADMAEWIPLKEIENIKHINSIDSVEIIRKAINIIK